MNKDTMKKRLVKTTLSWIGKLKKGAFKKQAQRHGMTTKEFVREVLAHKDKYDDTTVRRAYTAKTLMGFKK